MTETSLSIASELTLDLAHRFRSEGDILVFGDATLARAIGDNTSLYAWDIREQSVGGSTSFDPNRRYSTVLLPAPPNRDLLRRLILIASQALTPGGKCFIASANAEGGKSVIKDAESVFGKSAWSGYQQKHRMAILQRDTLETPPWALTPGIALGTWEDFNIVTPSGSLSLRTQAGVFAGAKLDAGTKLLLDHLEIESGSKVLDVGCGVGVIGITAAMHGADVTMTDANLLAVEAAAHNVEKLGLSANVIASDVYRHLDDQRFDLIVSNPPFHRGKQVDSTVANEIITGAAARLNPGRSLVIVANAFLAYGKQMGDVFTRVDTIAATPQYHVLRGTN